MKNSSKFFSNKECEYFPCHNGIQEEDFNCLFCYCPLNRFDDCPGNPNFTLKDDKTVKNCVKFLKNKLY